MLTSFLDFNELKSRVSIEQVLQLLGIALKQHNSQLRGCCPIHKGTDQRGFVDGRKESEGLVHPAHRP